MKTTLLSLTLCALALGTWAQSNIPSERDDGRPRPSAEAWRKCVPTPRLVWGDTDTRYDKYALPEKARNNALDVYAWRGENVNAQAVLYTAQALTNVHMEAHVNGWTDSTMTTAFVRYVLTDEFGSGCGYRPDPTQYDSLLVADWLDERRTLDVEAGSARPLWLRIQVPADARPGTYKGVLSVTSDNSRALRLPFRLHVADRLLPPPGQWNFHLDLWQNPYAVARFYDVPLWSDAHFAYMRPVMSRLAAAGQKVITATVMQHPWNGQTEDAFGSMVTRIRRWDGSWTYDYGVFDRWVEFMMSIGIDRQINCYTMVPWALRFDYLDQASNTIRYIEAKPGDPAYEAYWLPFLMDFARHLKERGWFERTTIAVDERSKEQMHEAFALLHKADPDFKISGAVHYYPEVEPQMYELCLAYGERLPEEVRIRRRQEGKLTTVYTCCMEAYPNLFTFSAPAEAAWLPWHTLAAKYDGYLRWAYNSWTAHPQQDTRFRAWPAGDCFLYYPGGSSIRLERLIEGIQDAEKVLILRDAFQRQGDTDRLQELEDRVNVFMPQNLTEANATEMVRAARQTLRRLSAP